jgi:hypothetical protein
MQSMPPCRTLRAGNHEEGIVGHQAWLGLQIARVACCDAGLGCDLSMIKRKRSVESLG